MAIDPGAEAIALYDDYTHTHLDRRRLIAGLVRLTGSTAAAGAMFSLLAANPAAAAIVAEGDPRLETHSHPLELDTGRRINLYEASPRGGTRDALPAVIVIHENRGLNAHIRDVARRVALAGFAAHAPDFLTASGGTPADEDAARAAIGALDRGRTVADAAALVRALKARHGSVGAVGFCWGGGMVGALAVEAGDALAAGVVYYGPAPDPAQAGRIRAPLLLHYAGLDERINAGVPPFADALTAARVPHTVEMYPGVNHAFNNDTAAGRYDKAAADLAWGRTIAFFKEKLGGKA